MAELEGAFKMLDSLTTKDRRLCVETLIKIFRNIDTNPDKVKYRSLKISNKRFFAEVWKHEGAQTLMLASGWIVLEDLVLLPDGADVSDTLKLLVDNREVKPDEEEWIEKNKIMGENKKKKREEELRTKALEEKAKEMARLKKDMAERKEIAERIVREHRNDIETRRIDRPSVAVPRGEGRSAKMRDMIPKQGGGG